MNSEYMTLAEIDAKYPNSWVLLTEPKVNEKQMVLYGGRVRFHSTDRTEFDKMLVSTTPERVSAIHYTGRPDPDMIYAFNL